MKEWREEPNSLDFTFGNYQCVILRTPEILILCGYVAIPSSHPFYKIEYPDIKCHGGITYSRMGLREYDEDGKHYWIGFDCGHAGDKIPLMDEMVFKNPNIFNRHTFSEGTYKNMNFVKMQLMNIIDQLIRYEI